MPKTKPNSTQPQLTCIPKWLSGSALIAAVHNTGQINPQNNGPVHRRAGRIKGYAPTYSTSRWFKAFRGLLLHGGLQYDVDVADSGRDVNLFTTSANGPWMSTAIIRCRWCIATDGHRSCSSARIASGGLSVKF